MLVSSDHAGMRTKVAKLPSIGDLSLPIRFRADYAVNRVALPFRLLLITRAGRLTGGVLA